jgi:hypothetical protein
MINGSNRIIAKDNCSFLGEFFGFSKEQAGRWIRELTNLKNELANYDLLLLCRK